MGCYLLAGDAIGEVVHGWVGCACRIDAVQEWGVHRGISGVSLHQVLWSALKSCPAWVLQVLFLKSMKGTAAAKMLNFLSWTKLTFRKLIKKSECKSEWPVPWSYEIRSWLQYPYGGPQQELSMKAVVVFWKTEASAPCSPLGTGQQPGLGLVSSYRRRFGAVYVPGVHHRKKHNFPPFWELFPQQSID